MAHGHKAHHGHVQPVPSKHHAAKHDRQMDAINDYHGRNASTSRMEDAHHHVSLGGRSTLTAGGSSEMHRSSKGAGLVSDGGRSDTASLRKVASGRLETAHGKNVR